MNRWPKIGWVLTRLLLLSFIVNLYLLGQSVKELRGEIATMRERQSLTWFNQMIFEGQVRGLENSSLVVVGHPGEGFFITIGDIVEDMGIGPYQANTYVNVDAGQPLTVVLRDGQGNPVDAAVLGRLDPGDLVVAWYSEAPSAAETSPDDWRLTVTHWTEKGLMVAIEHFTGGSG